MTDRASHGLGRSEVDVPQDSQRRQSWNAAFPFVATMLGYLQLFLWGLGRERPHVDVLHRRDDMSRDRTRLKAEYGDVLLERTLAEILPPPPLED